MDVEPRYEARIQDVPVGGKCMKYFKCMAMVRELSHCCPGPTVWLPGWVPLLRSQPSVPCTPVLAPEPRHRQILPG